MLTKKQLGSLTAHIGSVILCSAVLADLPALDPHATPVTKIGPGYQIALDVSVNKLEQSDFCRTFMVDQQGRLLLKISDMPLPPIMVKGLTIREIETHVAAAIKRYFVAAPVVRAGIVRIPKLRVTVMGGTLASGQIMLAEGSALSDALSACGYSPRADLHHIKVKRRQPEGGSLQIDVDFARALQGDVTDLTDPPLRDGDLIDVTVIPEIIVRQIAIQGEVKKPGFFDYKDGMMLKDMLAQVGGFTDLADFEHILITRKNPGVFLRVNGERAMKDIPTDNLLLKSDDVVVVPPKDRANRYSIAGAVASPYTKEFKVPVSLIQALADANLRPEADRKNILIMKNYILDPATATSVVVDLDKIVGRQQPDVMLQAGDLVNVPQKKKVPSPLLNIIMFIARRYIPFIP